ncbi:MAG: hypothetical protein GXY43_02635 [Clostridiaceae bacterium]|nr:hypothetical protein [Clostridiaceae bacterium]
MTEDEAYEYADVLKAAGFSKDAYTGTTGDSFTFGGSDESSAYVSLSWYDDGTAYIAYYVPYDQE